MTTPIITVFERSPDGGKGLAHQDLAETIGTYRETATQVLNDFKVRGLIEIGRKRIGLLDPERLAQIAQS